MEADGDTSGGARLKFDFFCDIGDSGAGAQT